MGDYLILRDGVELFYQRDLVKEPKGVILINHGFAEHMARYDHIAKYLKNSNYCVYRYDLRGHGRTKSPKGNISSYEDFIYDCDEMVELIKAEHKDIPIFMLGHSMGGFITCLYGLKFPNKLKGQIFSGAAVNTLPQAKGFRSTLYEILNLFGKNIKVKNPINNDLCKDEDVVIAYKNDPLVLKEATLNFFVQFLVKGRKYINKNIKNYKYPCFIMHGEEDRIVPKEIAFYLYNNISSEDKELKIYDGLYHEILNEKNRDSIIQDILNWMEGRR